jgi:hypothetical protein
MSSEEQRKFVSFLKKNKQNPDSQKLKLYKLIKEEKVNSKLISVKLYGKDNKVAYHQLRKRLFGEIVDFIANERFNQEEENVLEITKLILTGKYLIESKNYKTGFKLLDKAEKKAQEDSDVVSLDEIYNLLIQFSHYNSEIDLESTIKKLEQNRDLLIQDSNLNMAYATVKNKLEEYRLKGTSIEIEAILDEVFTRFSITEKSGYNYKTLYQLVQIISASANVTKDYQQVAPFVTERYKIIANNEDENNRYVFFHLKLLYFIANIFFREKNFKASNLYLEKMKSLIDRSNKKYEKIFGIKMNVLSALNNNYLGKKEEAVILIEKAITGTKDTKNKDFLDAMIVSSMINFQQKNYQENQTIFSKLNATENWYTKTMGVNWVMNKNLIEILTHIELENIDYADARLESFLFRHKEYLKQDKRAMVFLKYLKTSYTHPEKLKTTEFMANFYNSVETKPAPREDIYIMSFFAYLKSKMLGTDIYETTLELVRSEN